METSFFQVQGQKLAKWVIGQMILQMVIFISEGFFDIWFIFSFPAELVNWLGGSLESPWRQRQQQLLLPTATTTLLLLLEILLRLLTNGLPEDLAVSLLPTSAGPTSESPASPMKLGLCGMAHWQVPFQGCGTLDGWMGMDVCGDDRKMVVESVVPERFIFGDGPYLFCHFMWFCECPQSNSHFQGFVMPFAIAIIPNLGACRKKREEISFKSHLSCWWCETQDWCWRMPPYTAASCPALQLSLSVEETNKKSWIDPWFWCFFGVL